jgi:quercetin dioxygenase-like cupin family protein
MPTEPIRVGALTVRYLVEGDQSNGTAAVFECDVPTDARMPAPHSHDAYEETVYGLRGVTSFTVDGERIDVGRGDALCIRRGAVHHFDNHGTEDSTVLCAITPGILGPDYFREVGAILAAGGPPDLARIGDVMGRHGLTPAPRAA